MSKKFDPEIVSGSILRSVFKLGWPIILLQLVSGAHGFVDQLLIGNYVSVNGNAGVGVGWQVFLVILVSLSSLFHGMGIMIARYAGRQDSDTVNRIAYEVMLTAFYLAIFIIAPIGYFLAPTLLQWANAEPEVVEHGLPYLRVMFTAAFPLFLMFLLNGAFMSAGDPQTPLKLAVLTTIVNIATSYMFITGAGPFEPMGTVGAALGTCIGPIPSVVIALAYVSKRQAIIGPPDQFTIFPDLDVVKSVAKIGIPAGIQAITLNIGGLVLYKFIGALENSAEAQAAYAICYAQLFSFVTWTGFGLRGATATVMGQNLGAGKADRGVSCVYVSVIIGMLWAAAFGVLYWFFPEFLLGLFGRTEEPTLSIGVNLLRYLAFSGVFVLTALALTGGLQGAGDTKRPMVIAFITQIVILLGICVVFYQLERLTADVIWTAIFISHLTRLVLSFIVFRQAKWRAIKVEIEERSPSPAPLRPITEADAADSTSGAE